MIAHIRGELVAIYGDKVIVDVGGVGYGIFMPAQSMTLLPSIGEEVKLHTYLQVKEDLMQLYGFLAKDDLEIFKLVIGVSGIGPKGGLSILSELSADNLRFAILANDVKTIAKTPGIGKKTAEKLILELKDKLNIEDVLQQHTDEIHAGDLQHSELQSEAVQALVALGYGSTESMKAVNKVASQTDGTVEDVLKHALKVMMF